MPPNFNKLLAGSKGIQVLPFIARTAAAVLLAFPVLAAEETPYVPTPQIVVDTMLKLGRVGKDDFLIDLGSGDGRIVITAAKRFGARGFGVDHDPRLVDFANRQARDEGVADRAKFVRQDLFETDLKRATVLSMYLLPDVNLELRPRLWEQLRPGTRIVSHDYDLGDWRPDAKVVMPVPNKPVGPIAESTVFLFVVPAKVAGRWEGPLGKRVLALEVGQKFQDLEIAARIDGLEARVTDVRLEGTKLGFSFELDGKPAVFEGVAGGETIKGSLRSAGSRTPWSAARIRTGRAG